MAEELKELKKAKNKLSGLEKRLCDACVKFTMEQEKYAERDAQSRQQLSHHELAQNELKIKKKMAHMCTELESI